MAEPNPCPYCQIYRNHYFDTIPDKEHHAEIEIVDSANPYLSVHLYGHGGSTELRVGLFIKYCPMCGRRLGNDDL